MYYRAASRRDNARWYDPGLGRFAQADTLIPGAGNPQAWDRYAYTLNNPLKYVDPSGHGQCAGDDDDCTIDDDDYINYYKQTIKAKYNWNIQDDDWSVDELSKILQTGREIESYLDDLTGGNGLEWMMEYMGGINIANSINNPLGITNRGMALPAGLFGKMDTVYLPDKWLTNFGNPLQYFAHELAHVWDIRTGRGTRASVAYHLNDFTWGGKAPFTFSSLGLPWLNLGGTSPQIPIGYKFPKSVRGGYGNGCITDYLAESFSWNVFDVSNIPNPSVSIWLNSVIALQTATLP